MLNNLKCYGKMMKVPDDCLVFLFRNAMRGEAKVWVESISLEESFTSLTSRFISRFKSKTASVKIIKEMANLKCQEGKIMMYLDKMKGLSARVKTPEDVLIAFIINGLPVQISNALIANAPQGLTWDLIYSTCSALEGQYKNAYVQKTVWDDTLQINKLHNNLPRRKFDSFSKKIPKGIVKTCELHGKKGHSTNECFTLKKLKERGWGKAKVSGITDCKDVTDGSLCDDLGVNKDTYGYLSSCFETQNLKILSILGFVTLTSSTTC